MSGHRAERHRFKAPLTCDTCGSDLLDLTRDVEWLMAQLEATHEERDRYRGWFEKLLPIAWRGDPEARAEAERLRAERDRMAAGNRRRGEETRRKVLAAKAAGKSIVKTAQELDLHPTWVAKIRGKAKRGGEV